MERGSESGRLHQDGDKARSRERRRSPRFRLRKDALLYNQENFAEILDISESGLACRCLIGPDAGKVLHPDLDLLDTVTGRYVQGVSCRTARHCNDLLMTSVLKYSIRDCYFEFVNLGVEQVRELREFIRVCRLPDSKGPGTASASGN